MDNNEAWGFLTVGSQQTENAAEVNEEGSQGRRTTRDCPAVQVKEGSEEERTTQL